MLDLSKTGAGKDRKREEGANTIISPAPRVKTTPCPEQGTLAVEGTAPQVWWRKKGNPKKRGD